MGRTLGCTHAPPLRYVVPQVAVLIPMLRSKEYGSQDFEFLERSAQNVIPTEVEHFRPKPFIGQAAANDQNGSIGYIRHRCKERFPIAVRQAGVADHHWDEVLMEE